MIAQLVIRGHHSRRNVASAEKLSRYWSRVHSWDMNVGLLRIDIVGQGSLYER